MAPADYTVAVQVSWKSVSALISGAMAYGSGYWVRFIDELEVKPEPDHVQRCEYGLVKLPSPMCEGGAYIFRDEEAFRDDPSAPSVLLRLDLEAIRRGLKLMSDKWPRHFADILSERDDSTTADVFLQCCLLGDIIYG